MFASHESFGDKHGIQLEENFNKLPTIHWLPRVHGGPYKFRYIVNSRSCSAEELSVRVAFVLQAIGAHVRRCCHGVCENSGVDLFWSMDNSLEVMGAIESGRSMVSGIGAFGFSTLYASLPLHLVKNKLMGLVERAFAGGRLLLLWLVGVGPFSLILSLMIACAGPVGVFAMCFVFCSVVVLLGLGGMCLNKLQVYPWELIVHLWWLIFFYFVMRVDLWEACQSRMV